MATAEALARRLGAGIRELSRRRGPGYWHGPHMAAAKAAIVERIPLVDLVVEVRDARIPSTSILEPLENLYYGHKHMIVLNKADLADRLLTEKWVKHFREDYFCYQNNSHNKDNIKELLSHVRARIRELKVGESNYTAVILLVGIPNVGKSALANSMHQIGRIGAAEKGKLKHAIVSSQPGETKDISSYKIASHPNIYVLDTPGVLSPQITDDCMGARLALTGAIKDSLVGECELAEYFLAILNSSEEYKRWENVGEESHETLSIEGERNLVTFGAGQRKRGQYSSDHTQDFIVRDVRRTLFRSISSFTGDLSRGCQMEKLIEAQFTALQEAFRVSIESVDDGYRVIASKLLNLYRTGRLGHYTLDLVTNDSGK